MMLSKFFITRVGSYSTSSAGDEHTAAVNDWIIQMTKDAMMSGKYFSIVSQKSDIIKFTDSNAIIMTEIWFRSDLLTDQQSSISIIKGE